MKFHQLTILPFLTSTLARDHPRCTSNNPCWPSSSEWQHFNASISGGLIASHPSASVCHRALYNEAQCTIVKANWTSSDWRTAQPGGYSGILWELGSDQCFINSTMDSPCGQGLVAEYTVNASSVQDIQKAVKWAVKKNLYLVVKNTGHDHLGRSSGKGAFAIWTHNLRGRTWHDSFVAKGAPEGAKGTKAVTLQAGEQWLVVYQDADRQRHIVVGGSARTVGAAGGWVTGGGHSAWSYFYGLGVDNVLEVNIVTASGARKTLNQYTDAEHFWAIRGGGGNSWGIITSVTFKTHPNPTHIKTIAAQYITNETIARREVLKRLFQAIPSITDLGYTGYGTLDLSAPIGLIFIQPNGTNTTASEVVKLLDHAGNVSGVEIQAGGFDFSSWIAYCDAFLQDPNIATNVIDPSRLLSAEILMNKTEDLLDLLEDYPDRGAGFNFIGKVDSTFRDATAVHSAWKTSRAIFSMGSDWADDAPESEKRLKKLQGVEVSRRLAEIVGESGGAYINEANPYEPEWEKTFWGDKYGKLERVKKRVDPRGLFVCNRCVGGHVVYEP